jgi:predicted transcriptional regulator
MNTSNRILNVKVGETLKESGRRAAAAMNALAAGKKAEPCFGVGFEQVGQMFAAFTPKRWELIAALRAAGPLTVADPARQLGRNYKKRAHRCAAVDRVDGGGAR